MKLHTQADRLSSTSSSPNSTLGKGNLIFRNVRNIGGLYRYQAEKAPGEQRGDDQLRLGLKKVQYLDMAQKTQLPNLKAQNQQAHLKRVANGRVETVPQMA